MKRILWISMVAALAFSATACGDDTPVSGIKSTNDGGASDGVASVDDGKISDTSAQDAGVVKTDTVGAPDTNTNQDSGAMEDAGSDVADAASGGSCKGRCFEFSLSYPCQCNEGCSANGNCCADYTEVCSVCTPKCDGKSCGSDGCDGTCGKCGDGETCDLKAGKCVKPACVPNCTETGAQCGDNGCNGSCGGCSAGLDCKGGKCVKKTTCAPTCSRDAECGSDGCNGTCGKCGDGKTCKAGKCVTPPCVPNCKKGAECGDDGCGGFCGKKSCGKDPQYKCLDTKCYCFPQCKGKVCGDDGCGGTCGKPCGDSAKCASDGSKCISTCVGSCDGKLCGTDGCGNVCGVKDCGSGSSCKQVGALRKCVADPTPDAGTTDAGTADAGSSGTADAGTTDTGAPDAGGTIKDAGAPDTSTTDTGTADAGGTTTKDAGAPDAGKTDAGTICVKTGAEICGDGKDNDCNGKTDAGDDFCLNKTVATVEFNITAGNHTFTLKVAGNEIPVTGAKKFTFKGKDGWAAWWIQAKKDTQVSAAVTNGKGELKILKDGPPAPVLPKFKGNPAWKPYPGKLKVSGGTNLLVLYLPSGGGTPN